MAPSPWYVGAVDTGQIPRPVFFLQTRGDGCPYLQSARKAGGIMSLGLLGTGGAPLNSLSFDALGAAGCHSPWSRDSRALGEGSPAPAHLAPGARSPSLCDLQRCQKKDLVGWSADHLPLEGVWEALSWSTLPSSPG